MCGRFALANPGAAVVRFKLVATVETQPSSPGFNLGAVDAFPDDRAGQRLMLLRQVVQDCDDARPDDRDRRIRAVTSGRSERLG